MGQQTELEKAAELATAALRDMASGGLTPEIRAAASVILLLVVLGKTMAPVIDRLMKSQTEGDEV